MSEREELADLLGKQRVMFWMCPVKEHNERKGVVIVEWVGDIAHCTLPGCDKTSAVIDTPAQADGDGDGA